MARRARKSEVSEAEAASAEPSVEAVVVKANGRETMSSALLAKITAADRRVSRDLVQVPYDPAVLNRIYEASSALRQCIDAYVTNIDLMGFQLTPAIDLSSPFALEKIRDSLLIEQALAGQQDLEVPDEEELKRRREDLRLKARIEFARLTAFFAFCYPDGTFKDLRRKTRTDLELTGNAYWEVLRGDNGTIRNFIWASSIRMRIGKGGPHEAVVTERRPVADLVWTDQKQRKPFQRYAQVNEDTEVPEIWFKGLGDPRTLSRATGEFYGSEAEFKEKEGQEALPATEILHFAIHAPNSPYGVPRWIGNLLAVLGLREVEEVNHAFFTGNSVPPLALLVSGGRLGKDTHERVREFFEQQVKGKGSIHRLVILEAEGQSKGGNLGPSATPRMAFVPLRGSQVADALFQEYDRTNRSKISSAFRIPPAYFGGSGASKTEMSAAMRFAEEQVFGPERGAFDDVINRTILSELGASFWSFHSNCPSASDPEVVGPIVTDLSRYGVLTPAEARQVIGPILGRELAPIHEEWATRPIAITVAMLGARSGPAEAVREQNLNGRREPRDGDADGEARGSGRPDEFLRRLERSPEEAALAPASTEIPSVPELGLK